MQKRGDMMSGPRIMELLFYGWWMVYNGRVQYLEIDFLGGAVGKPGRKLTLLWIAVNELFIMAKLWAGITNGFMFHILLLLLFSVTLLKIPWRVAVAPLVIIGTLYTFIEGYSAVCMYWISRHMGSKVWGVVLQIGISLLLLAVYDGILRLVRRRYSAALQWPVSSYLYVLLFPCGFIVLLVRVGLKLDSGDLERYFSAVGIDTSIAVFLILSGAMVIFLLMIRIFCIIVDQAQRENRMALLNTQLEGQKTYVDEAEQRNREYSKFQHDIHNHLLVLSGLMRERDYEKAQEYVDRLYARSRLLTGTDVIVTGSGVLDVLLREKVSFGMGNGIRVICNVRIPEDFCFDEMDLCIVFGNILDNGIRECMKDPAEDKEISVCTKSHGRFLVIESVNSWTPRSVEEGIGLTNIRNVAAKYQGMAEICSRDGRFSISVLLRTPGKDGVV